MQASHTGGVIDPSTFPIASPWSTSHLERIVAEDIFGSDLPTNTRAAAMRIPSAARSRNLLVSTICDNPLVSMRRDQVLPTQPAWLTSSPDGTSPQLRMAWTVDDLIWYGWSCWWRNNDPETGFPTAAGRLNQGSWAINADNRIEIHGQVVPDNAVILIAGLHEGVLSYGKETLEDVRTLYRNVRNRLATPTPGLNLHQTGGKDLTETEIDALIERWAVARRGGNGGVSYTNQHITAESMAGDGVELMIEARNAAAVDVARLIGLHAGMIDATTPKASLNYETATGRNQEFVDLDMGLYMTPIKARLSMDDVCPSGERIAFDLSNLTVPAPAPTGPALED